MLDHVGMAVSDYEKSKVFYTQALASLGYKLIMEQRGWCGFGHNDEPNFWIHKSDKLTQYSHVAFKGNTRTDVDVFYEAAITAGGKDNGAPGVREGHPNYYVAFVLDPDGNNIEVVCHETV